MFIPLQHISSFNEPHIHSECSISSVSKIGSFKELQKHSFRDMAIATIFFCILDDSRWFPMISRILIFCRPFWIFGGHFASMQILVFFLKWCSIITFNSAGPKFWSFLASDAWFPRYGGLKFRNVLSVGKIWPLTPEYSGAIGWIGYKSHSRLPPHPWIIMLAYPAQRFKTRVEIAFQKSRKIIIISWKIQRENNSLARGDSVQTKTTNLNPI